ncbi:MAG TPA: vitamin K epoxide reductase family protein, partial [Labilithrix sp.]
MRKEVAFWTTLAACAAALAASASLLVDYVRPAPVFCGDGGGCGLVKKTVFAYPFGIPMPVFGLVGMLAIAMLALVPGRRARLAQAALAGVGAVVAAMLLVVQALMHTICPFCAVTDGSAIVICALSILRLYREWDPPANRHQVFAGSALAMLAVLGPMALGFGRKPKPPPIGVPDIVRAEMEKSPSGVITVIDFADYECPFCRATHEKLAPVLAQNKDHVRIVRKNVPLRMHPHATDMARTACCAELL